jgi:hypothetical protein
MGLWGAMAKKLKIVHESTPATTAGRKALGGWGKP